MKRIFTSLLVALSATNAQASIICKKPNEELNENTPRFEFHGEHGIQNTPDWNGSGITQFLYSCELTGQGYHTCFREHGQTVITMVLVDDSTVVQSMFNPSIEPMTVVFDGLECSEQR